jgi:AcrR family transcriptional regulator
MSGASTAPRRGPGRPSDGSDRRAVILAVARDQFAAKGYAGASLRGIAREAGVDPALVHHYFGGKDQLFVAAVELPFNPADRLPELLAGGPAELPERLVRIFLGMWSDPSFRTPMIGLVRSAFSSEEGSRMLREFLSGTLLARVGAALGPLPPERIQAAVAQLVGVVILKHVIRLEPLASTPDEDLVQLLAPTVRRYLTEG